MLLAFVGVAQKYNFSPTLTNHLVLYRVTLLFATVILLLRVFVLGTIEPTFGAINDKLQTRTLIEYRF